MVECSEEVSLDAKEVTKREPKLARKNRSSVTYDGVQEVVILYYHVYDYFCLSRSINGDFDWFIVYYLSQLVDNDKNRVIAVVFLVRRQW